MQTTIAPSSVYPLDDRSSEPDLHEQLAQADRDDWLLLVLVVCTALATLTLAAAVSLLR